MTYDRYRELMETEMCETGLTLTEEEIARGWHFCADWDGLLIGPGMGELAACQCPWVDPLTKKVTETQYNLTNLNLDDPPF